MSEADDIGPLIETTRHFWVYGRGVRPSLELEHNITFLLNVSGLVGESPAGKLAVAPGHDLRRADKQEVQAIKDILGDYGAERISWYPWECAKSADGKFTKLPEDQWRYFVIAFTGPTATIEEIQYALSIAPLDIRIAFTLMSRPFPNKGPGLLFNPGRLFNSVQEVQVYKRLLPVVDLTMSDVEDMNRLRNQLRSVEPGIIDSKRAIQQMLDLEALSNESPLLFLGYFAILESQLTHQPKPTDTIDSITRQIVKKLTLLDNRWEPRIDYRPFQGAKPDTIWSTMYRYRSSLAHGGEPDFKHDLVLLQDHECALKLLKVTLKAVLRQALIEPQLITDLRNC